MLTVVIVSTWHKVLACVDIHTCIQQYRDRAGERRKGENKDYGEDESLLSSYKAVAPADEAM